MYYNVFVFWEIKFNNSLIAKEVAYVQSSTHPARESVWNKENLFTGWTDVDLSEKGVSEAHNGGKLLKEGGYTFDIAFTSVLKRAIRTLWIVLEDMDLMWIPVVRSWRLNERMYGDLQGLNKAQTAEKFGEEQVHRVAPQL